MPNPIDRVVPGAEIVIRPGAMVRNRPQLALMLIETLTRWAFVECSIGDALAVILRKDAAPAVQKFIQHPNNNRRREILNDFARQRLPAEDFETLQVLLELFAEDFRQRNRLAHWLSGYSPQIPDGILLMDPSEQWKHLADFGAWLEDALDKTAYMEKSPSPVMPRDEVFVYKTADFERIGKSIAELIKAFGAFNEMYSSITGVGHAARAHGYARLRSLPRFLEAKKRHERRRA